MNPDTPSQIESLQTVPVADAPAYFALVDEDGIILKANKLWEYGSNEGDDLRSQLDLDERAHQLMLAKIYEVANSQLPIMFDAFAPAILGRHWARILIWETEDNNFVVCITQVRNTLPQDSVPEAITNVERVLENTADSIAVFDESLKVRFATGIISDFLGVTVNEYMGRDVLDFVYSEDQAKVAAVIGDVMTKPEAHVRVTFRSQHSDGSTPWLEAIATNLLEDPVVRGVLVSLHDITELVEITEEAAAATAALAIEKARYEALARFTPTGVFELDKDLNFTYANDRFRSIAGHRDSALPNWNFIDLRDRQTLLEKLGTVERGRHVQSTVRSISKDGEIHWVTFRADRSADGQIIGTLEDDTQVIQRQSELEYRAGHDDLTALPNREHLMTLIDEILHADESIAVLFIDLDHFKDINDVLGHHYGDQVLIEVAKRIQRTVRPGDLVGRMHGDEFLVVGREINTEAEAVALAERIISAIGKPDPTNPSRPSVTASIGVALTQGSTFQDTFESYTLLADADIAMYEAKVKGGARVSIFNNDLALRSSERLRIRSDLRRAITEDELVMYYQPVVELSSGNIVRNEALIRWNHPTQGLLTPGRFMADIERSPLMEELGAWIMHEVVTDVVRHDDALPVNVNISPQQLVDNDFATDLLKLLDEHDFDPKNLALEVTELVRLSDHGEVQLQTLRSAGCRIVVDDFGSGFSSLAYLQRFEFDQVKIDGSFVEDIDTDPVQQAIVRAVIGIAAATGATVVAEKIERQAQAETLQSLGCNYGQGYLLGRPLAPTAALLTASAARAATAD